MSDPTGYTDRPWQAGKGALTVMYLFGVPAGFLLMFLAVASVQLGGPLGILDSGRLTGLAAAMVTCAVAALAALVVAIIQSYSADIPAAATRARADRPARRESTAAQKAPADPWAGHEVAPETGRLTADELAPVA